MLTLVHTFPVFASQTCAAYVHLRSLSPLLIPSLLLHTNTTSGAIIICIFMFTLAIITSIDRQAGA